MLHLAELSSDITIRTHLSALYDTLLEQNLLRIVEPYSIVEVEYVAEQVKQGRQAVEQKYVASPSLEHFGVTVALSDCPK